LKQNKDFAVVRAKFFMSSEGVKVSGKDSAFDLMEFGLESLRKQVA